MKYTKNIAIERFLMDKEKLLHLSSLSVSLKREIPYGAQILITSSSGEGVVNIYHSMKKGISIVDASKNPISEATIDILSGRKSTVDVEASANIEKSFNTWFGTDESGKGDFFGPLVVAGFIADKTIDKELRSLGIDDSKKLKSADIWIKGATLFENYSDRIVYKIFSNKEYNELYKKIKNLNHLLASGHIYAIEKALSKNYKLDGVVADRFADKSLIEKGIGDRSFELIQRSKGEENVAVAAASIIARYLFESEIKNLSEKYSVKIPFGCGKNVFPPARKVIDKFGKAELINLVKTHFKTYSEL